MAESTKKLQPVIEVINASKEFTVGKKPIKVIKNVSLEIYPGEFVIIYGPSGCGKSTLLNIMNGWEPPSEGEVKIFGNDIYKKSEDDRTRMRQGGVALVHQSSNWIKSLSVIDNIMIPYLLAGKSKGEALRRALPLLKTLHLDQFSHYKPMDLSGGQQQRIALLRALIDNPKIIMADEPTGNLDSSSSHVIMDLFERLNSELGRTVIMVTHNLDLLSYANKKINILDGQIVNVEGEEKFHPEEIDNEKDVLDLTVKFNKDIDKELEEMEMSKIK